MRGPYRKEDPDGLDRQPIELLPSKQEMAVRFRSPAPRVLRCHNACKARAADGRPPASEAGCRGWLGLPSRYLAYPLAPLDAVELLTHRKDPGLLVRKSWARIPPVLQALADTLAPAQLTHLSRACYLEHAEPNLL